MPDPSDASGRKPFSLQRGIDALTRLTTETEDALRSELELVATRLAENQRREQLFGSTETIRNERSQIIYDLNPLLLREWSISFNDLCHGVLPQGRRAPAEAPPAQPPVANGAERPAQAEPDKAGATTAAEVQAGAGRLLLQLALTGAGELEARVLAGPYGEPRHVCPLPYSADELIAVVKGLEHFIATGMFNRDDFTPAQTEALERHGLLLDGDFVPELLDRVGQQLYQALFQSEINTALKMAQQAARAASASAVVQLRFDQDDVLLSRYPWELLHDGYRALLPSKALELTRYITYAEPAPGFAPAPPIEVLYIAASPRGLDQLPAGHEGYLMREALAELEREGVVKVVTLPRPTFEALQDYQEGSHAQVLHFDGHGVFGRQCRRCQTMCHPHLAQCPALGCGASLKHSKPAGFLAFETDDGAVDWVRTSSLSALFYGSQIQLAVLSACFSGTVRGESLFSGAAPALILAGVPAVVGNQLAITVKAGTQFMRSFYRALAKGAPVAAAANQGRQRIMRGGEWFIPVLYLRSSNERALF